MPNMNSFGTVFLWYPLFELWPPCIMPADIRVRTRLMGSCTAAISWQDFQAKPRKNIGKIRKMQFFKPKNTMIFINILLYENIFT